MEIPIIKEIVVIFALSIAVLLVCHRLGLPSVVGFLMTGVFCGPHGMALVGDVEDVQNLATIGVVLLLFTVGMEFSVKSIIKYKYYFFGGGTLQIANTLLICLAIGKYALGGSWAASLLLGFLIALSSTAIVLRVLDEKGEAESPHGRLSLGVLIFQDIIAVPMMLLVPILAGVGEGIDLEHIYNFGKGLAILIFIAFMAFRGVPKLLYYVTRTRSRELFLLSVLTICFAVAWITSSIGLSLSLGAFLAGLVISESEYSHEAVGHVLPFQEIFTSFFFVSMGMLLDMSFVFGQPLLIACIAAGVFFLKFATAGGAALALGMPLRSAVLAGVALSQIGEFSFVIAHSGMGLGLISDYQYQLFLAVSLLTMTLTPSLMTLSTYFAHFLDKLPFSQKLKRGYKFASEPLEQAHTDGHMIIVGFGVRGKHLARAAKKVAMPYVVLEMNSETVRQEKIKGEPIHYGDPSHHSVLIHAGIKTAKILAVVINDPMAAINIIKTARKLNAQVHIIARTRYFQEVQQLFEGGADDVVPDEFGSSLELFSRVLQKCEVPFLEAAKYINELRLEGYRILHLQNMPEGASMLPISPLEANVQTLKISKGSPLAGKTIAESQLRKMHGLTVLMIKRKEANVTNIEATTLIEEEDTLVVIGTPDNLQKVQPLFQTA